MAKTLTEFMGEVPRVWNTVAFSAALVVSGYGWFTYSNVYRWVSELQLATLGSFSTKLSVLLTVLLNMVIFGALVRLLVSLKVIRRATDAEVQAHVERTMAQRHGFKSPYLFPIMLAPWGLIALGAGLWAHLGGKEVEATRVTHAQVLKGDIPRANYITIGGHLVPDGAVSYGSTGSVDNYIPLLPLDWDVGQPIKVFVETREVLPESIREVTGMKWPLGLPGPVRAEFEKVGLDVKNAILIKLGSTPPDWARTSLLMFIVGGVMLGIAAVTGAAALVAHRRERAAESQTVDAPQPAPPA
ncbi:MAG TPA: hypothetical protein VD997_09520 [Phycisphaerales bacterium]|nr:hypothetical protein [Phycisphaerales bacterium]